MRSVTFALIAILLTGCSTVIMPNYITDKNPYKRRFDAEFGRTLEATKATLVDLGWTIKEEKDPGIYERAWQLADPSVKHILILTEYNKSNFFVHSKNTVINAYIRENSDGASDVELRYLSVNTHFFKEFFQYRNDKLINKIYKHIEEKLQGLEPGV